MNDIFQSQRAPSVAINDPLAAYRDWMNQYPGMLQQAQDAARSSGGGGPSSLSDLIAQDANQLSTGQMSTTPGLYDYSQPGTGPLDYKGVDPSIIAGNINAALSAAQNPSNPGGVLPYGTTIGALSQGDWQNLLNFQAPQAGPTPLDTINTQRDQQTTAAQDALKKAQAAQSAYGAQLGGGTPGGVLPSTYSVGSFSTNPGGAAPDPNAAPDANSLANPANPFLTPGFSAGGLGGLGGYNPNPWSTSSTNAGWNSPAQAATSSAGPSANTGSWGGPFSNVNPFAPR